MLGPPKPSGCFWPSPYLRKHPEGHEALREAFERRWRCVLAVAVDTGAGGGGLDRVIFAIPGRGKRSRANLEVFRRILG